MYTVVAQQQITTKRTERTKRETEEDKDQRNKKSSTKGLTLCILLF